MSRKFALCRALYIEMKPSKCTSKGPPLGSDRAISQAWNGNPRQVGMRETRTRAYQKSMTDPVVFESDKEDIKSDNDDGHWQKAMATREMGRAAVRMRKKTMEKRTGMASTKTRKARIVARWETSGLGNLTTRQRESCAEEEPLSTFVLPR